MEAASNMDRDHKIRILAAYWVKRRNLSREDAINRAIMLSPEDLMDEVCRVLSQYTYMATKHKHMA